MCIRDRAPAMQAVVSALVGLAEPWQAVQVWARLGKDVLTLAEDGAYTMTVSYTHLTTLSSALIRITRFVRGS